MNEREKNIHLWFEMWLTKQDLGIDNIFAEDVIYTESCSNHTLFHIRHLGKKSLNEIKTSILDLGFQYPSEREKLCFLSIDKSHLVSDASIVGHICNVAPMGSIIGHDVLIRVIFLLTNS